jgi:hypothetical protein
LNIRVMVLLQKKLKLSAEEKPGAAILNRHIQ